MFQLTNTNVALCLTDTGTTVLHNIEIFKDHTRLQQRAWCDEILVTVMTSSLL